MKMESSFSVSRTSLFCSNPVPLAIFEVMFPSVNNFGFPPLCGVAKKARPALSKESDFHQNFDVDR